MYRIRTPGYAKADQARRWALPDRVFFACGACHILAHAVLERHGRADHRVTWIRPDAGFAGHHIVVEDGARVFDYHGCTEREAFLRHTWRRARQLWPGWGGTLVTLPRDVLVSEARSRTFEGLRLREPGQFLHDPLPRARRFLDRFEEPARSGEPVRFGEPWHGPRAGPDEARSGEARRGAGRI